MTTLFEKLILDFALVSKYGPRSVHDIMIGNVIAELKW